MIRDDLKKLHDRKVSLSKVVGEVWCVLYIRDKVILNSFLRGSSSETSKKEGILVTRDGILIPKRGVYCQQKEGYRYSGSIYILWNLHPSIARIISYLSDC